MSCALGIGGDLIISLLEVGFARIVFVVAHYIAEDQEQSDRYGQNHEFD
jgi:hypothetical protein